MHFSCPNCSRSYNVSARMIGEEGRDVRCAVCGHRWHQKRVGAVKADNPADAGEETSHEIAKESDAVPVPPAAQKAYGFDPVTDTDKIKEDDSADQNPEAEGKATDNTQVRASAEEDHINIPEGIKPATHEEASYEDKAPAAVKTRKPVKRRVAAVLMAAGVVFMLILTGVVLKPTLLGAYPALASVYERAGLPVRYGSEGLTFGRIEAVQEDSGLRIMAVLGNETEQTITLAPLMASFGLGNEDGPNFIIQPPTQRLAPGEQVIYQDIYSGEMPQSKMLKLTFEPMPL